jgi:hypothetical protein
MIAMIYRRGFMRNMLSSLLTGFFVFLIGTTPVFANSGYRGGHERHGQEVRHEKRDSLWHGDIHHFREHDFDKWRSGHWIHDFRGGRESWWWVAGGLWYVYPAPLYPYPDPYTPPGVIIDVVPGTSSPYYYHCENPEGYFPYVEQCVGVWERVSSIPAPVESPRDKDYRQLNTYADEFYHIDVVDPDAREKLKILKNKVALFRKPLPKRKYNAMDVLKDSEDLRDRILAKEKELSRR